eukprot:11763690-Alexandrium_andersonii.AAC.1
MCIRDRAKNDLESFCFSIRDVLTDKRLRHEFEVGDMGIIEKTVQDTLDWVENRLPEQDEREAKRELIGG